MKSVLVQSRRYATQSGAEQERVYAHTHVSGTTMHDAMFDVPSLTIDNVFDQIELWCTDNGKVIDPDAIYRIEVEVDVRDD